MALADHLSNPGALSNVSEATIPAAGEAVTPANADAPAPDQLKTVDPSLDPAVEGQDGEAAAADKDGQQEGEGDKERRKNRVSPSARISFYANRAKAAEAALEQANAKLERLQRPPPANVEDMDYEQREAARLARVLDEREARSVVQETHELAAEVHNARVDTFAAQMEAAKERMPDLAEKLGQVPVSEFVADFVVGSERPAEIAYFLATNPEAAKELQVLTDPRRMTARSVQQAARMLAQIETRVSAPSGVRRATQVQPTGRNLTGGQAPSGQRVEEINDMEAYAAARKKAWAAGNT
jgi:hypothetical protein